MSLISLFYTTCTSENIILYAILDVSKKTYAVLCNTHLRFLNKALVAILKSRIVVIFFKKCNAIKNKLI